ncbi:chaplin family protein [Streptomyces sp. NPDC016845]|uniref:chaplin n=1 Tax=Streptomyces sp. NPDC016845 TaxID=3364972 RepID=UPI0037B35875
MRQVTRKGLITVAAASGVLAVTGGYAHADAGAQGGASNSPGVASGNEVQAPVHAPVNLCGNTVNVVGLLNPAMGNNCGNASHGSESGGKGHGGKGHGGKGGGGRGGSGSHDGGYGSDSQAQGSTSNSPGVGSGNNVQAPVDVPANACGNSVNVIGIGNPVFGNECGNPTEHTPEQPGEPEQPPAEPHEPGTPDNPDDPENPENPDNPDTPGTPGTPETRGGHFVGEKPDTPNRPEAQSAVEAPESESQLAMTGSSLPLGAAIPVGAGALLAGAVLYRRVRANA